MTEIPVELLQALLDSASQDGCSDDLIVVSSADLAAVFHAAGIEVGFGAPEVYDDDDRMPDATIQQRGR